MAIKKIPSLGALAIGVLAASSLVLACETCHEMEMKTSAPAKATTKNSKAKGVAKTGAKASKRVAKKTVAKKAIAKKPAAKAPAKVVRRAAPAPVVAAASEPKKEVAPVLRYTVKSLDGKDVDLSQYDGKAVLIVNTASKCGYTKQYAGLQALHEKYAGKGLVVLGFPANDFGQQEPGSDEEISLFCQKNYGVTFPMFTKTQVKGEGKAPLFQYLTSEETNPASPGEIGWNFEKFLIGRDGKIQARFKSGVAPESDEMAQAVEKALATG
jgi:glutathione peroxidase